MSLGVILLVHTALGRAGQVARHWAKAGCPVVIHVDAKVPRARMDAFRAGLRDVPGVIFSRRHRCEWGTWGIVAASLDAAQAMLDRTQVRHVYLASGACLPLRPVDELRAYLDARPRTDFIESATVADVPWTVDGLDAERFTLHFPVSWRRNRWLFDRLVESQRALGIRRRPPRGIAPHIGSQWWCLTRGTLEAILTNPDRAAFDAYFRRVWIPDESYFQTLARRFSAQIESRSLTLSKFDFQGKPHIFYDDHLQLLRRSDAFVARKIWPHADRLYATFLAPPAEAALRAEPNPGKVDRLFSKAGERRTRGRPGLYMHSRFPNAGWENGVTAGPYAVFHGFAELFESFEPWLAEATGARVHGHLFAPERAEFEGGAPVIEGALTDDAALRDVHPEAFLTNLIWNTRGRMQAFQYGPGDTPKAQDIMIRDSHARIAAVPGAWMIPLYRGGGAFDAIRQEAARLQRIEHAMIDRLRVSWAKARIRIWSIADVLEAPGEVLHTVLDDLGAPMPADLPALRRIDGLPDFLQRLKNAGMHPYILGDIPAEPAPDRPASPRRRPYAVN